MSVPCAGLNPTTNAISAAAVAHVGQQINLVVPDIATEASGGDPLSISNEPQTKRPDLSTLVIQQLNKHRNMMQQQGQQPSLSLPQQPFHFHNQQQRQQRQANVSSGLEQQEARESAEGLRTVLQLPRHNTPTVMLPRGKGG